MSSPSPSGPERPVDPTRVTEPITPEDPDGRTEPLAAGAAAARRGRLSRAEAEALLGGGGPAPLREVLAAASGPARRHELLGQEAALAAFVDATATKGTEPSVPAAVEAASWRERWRDRRVLRGPAGVALAVALGLATAGAAAAAVVLATPDRPAPPPPAELVPSSTAPAGTPVPSRSAFGISYDPSAPSAPTPTRVLPAPAGPVAPSEAGPVARPVRMVTERGGGRSV